MIILLRESGLRIAAIVKKGKIRLMSEKVYNKVLERPWSDMPRL